MRQNRLAWVALRDARVFHFDPMRWCEIYHAMDRFCTEVISGYDYRPPKLDAQGHQLHPDDVPEEESEAHALALMSASPGAPYPEQFPFDSIFIGLGQGINLSDMQAMSKFHPRQLPDNLVRASVVGVVMTTTGYVWEVFKLQLSDDPGYTLLQHRTPEGWRQTIDLAPWYNPVLVETINDHKTFVVEGYPGDLQKKVRHSRKFMGLNPGRSGKFWTPPPFYRVQLQDKLVTKRIENLKPAIRRQLQYRHDVRGHERCYVRRGALPLADDKRSELVERGYKVFESLKPDDETNARLFKRGYALKKPDEWLALMAVWVDDHMRGDESLPYIPALRVAKNTG